MVSNGDVVAEAGASNGAVCGLVDDIVAPETGNMVLVVPSAAPFKGHSELIAGVDSEVRVGVGVAGIPDLLLAAQAEVVIPIYGDPLDLNLREAVADRSGPGKVEEIAGVVVAPGSRPGQANDGVSGEAAVRGGSADGGIAGVVEQPILIVGRLWRS